MESGDGEQTCATTNGYVGHISLQTWLDGVDGVNGAYDKTTHGVRCANQAKHGPQKPSLQEMIMWPSNSGKLRKTTPSG